MTDHIIDIPDIQNISDSMQDSDGDDTSPPVETNINDELNTPSQQPNPSDLMENNHGNNTSPPLTAARAKFVPMITIVLWLANTIGVLAGFIFLFMLVKEGILLTLPRMDFWFIIVIFFFLWHRYCTILSSQANSFINGGSSALSPNIWRTLKDMQQLAVPTHYISWCKIVSAMISAVLSIMGLSNLYYFGETEEAYKANQITALSSFYILAFAEALLILAANVLEEKV